MPLQPGQVVNDRYRIVKLIGQGGFGAVYRAWDIAINQPCALKENLENTPQAQSQFQREASVLAGLRHPNLPRVTDYFSLTGQGQYLVMDFVQGDNLEVLRLQYGNSVTEAMALGWILHICNALEYMHTQVPPVIHRDIKPQNILINPLGQAVLVDFGICKLYTPGQATTSGARAVTAGYSPPEQYGSARTDPRSDIYSLGATLYYVLTGQEPPESIDRMTHGVALKAPRQLNPAVSPAVENAILNAMEVDIQKRCQSAAHLGVLLQGNPPAGQVPTMLAMATGAPVSAVYAPPAPVFPVAKSPNIPVQAIFHPAAYPPTPASPVRSPAVGGQGARPKGLTAAAIFTMVFGGPIGIAGGVGMLLGRNWGRVLSMIWLNLLYLAGAFCMVGFGVNSTDYHSSYYRLDEEYVLSASLSMLTLVMALGFFLYLLQPPVKNYFKPARAPHRSHVNDALNFFAWLNILLLFPMVLPLINGIFMLKNRRRWNWVIFFIQTTLFWMAGGSVFGLGISERESGLITAGLVIIAVFMQLWLFLLRKDVRQACP